MSDNEARAREVANDFFERDGEGPALIRAIAAALSAAEARGHIAGLKEAEIIFLGRTVGAAAREIAARLAALTSKEGTP